jgi:hypothetical protein
MYRIILVCNGVPAHAGAVAAQDITEEFHPQAVARGGIWDRSALILQADNDFDANGLALLGECSDAVSACIKGGFDGLLEVLSLIA